METRREPRINLKININIAIDDSTKAHFDTLQKDIEAESVDISVVGIGLLSRYFFPAGAVLKLSFVLPFRRKKDKISPIFVLGEVCYTRSSGQGLNRIGIKFLNLTEKDRDMILKFVKGDPSRPLKDRDSNRKK